jgi:hypothetical protein
MPPKTSKKSSGKKDVRLLEIVKSPKADKKWMAVFERHGRTKKTHFGQKGAEDYTMHKDKTRRDNYINRHKKREDWMDPVRAGTLSRYLLWGDSTSFNSNLAQYRKKFGL